MSYYQSNVTWQSPDGTWNVGFHLLIESVEDEWDQIFDESKFEYVYTARTEDAVWDLIRNESQRPNPGGGYVHRWLPEDRKVVDAVLALEAMKTEWDRSGRTGTDDPVRRTR